MNEGPKENLHIYLLIGQSNMAGRAAYTEAEAKPIDNCFLFTRDNRWEPATNPLNRHSTIRKNLKMQQMSPGYMFARTMLETKTDISIGLVVNAKGGTKIEQWAKGTTFYNDAVKRARAAGQTGVIKGILWHQGEGNAGNPDGYLEKLARLVKDLREDLDEPHLFFVAGQISKVPAINEQIAKLPQAVDHTAYVSSEGLTTKDRLHFDATGMKALGRRYAEEVMKREPE